MQQPFESVAPLAAPGTRGRGALRSAVAWFAELGNAARFILLGGLFGVLFATGAATLVDDQVTQLLLRQTTERAIDQLQLSPLGSLTAADFEPPYTAERLDQLAVRLEPLRAQVRRDGSDVLRLNLFDRRGTIVYSDRSESRGQTISPSDKQLLAAALAGSVASNSSTLSTAENVDLRPRYAQALEVYVPVVQEGRVVGAYEIYQEPGPMPPLRALVWIALWLPFLIGSYLAARAVEAGAWSRMAARVGQRLPHRPSPPGTVDTLTPRELDVLRLLATTHTYREIAEELVIGEETVRSHVKSVLRKLQQPDRTQAVVAAVRAGLIDLS